MPIPDQLPASEKESSDEMRRKKTIDKIKHNLTAALQGIQHYMGNHSDADAIKRLHFDNTDILTGQEDKSVRMRYYSLWDVSNLRILENGSLARPSDEKPNYLKTMEKGADESTIVTINELETNHEKYNLARLSNIALRLETMLTPIAE